MSWVRFDDRAMDHPKFLALTASAFRLWFEGMAYCNKHLTDGVISRLALKGFRYLTSARVDELVVQVLWEPHEVGFYVHDYLDWNDDRATVLKNRERARARSSAVRTGERMPYVPSGVVKSLSVNVNNSEKERLEKVFSEFWAAYPRKEGLKPARELWHRMKPSPDLTGKILSALEVQRRSPNWAKDDGAFVPHAKTWLFQQRWTDEIPPSAAERVTAAAEWDCQHEPRCPHRAACQVVSMRGE